MIGKCKAIAHGSTALDYIFREGKLGSRLAFHNLCSREFGYRSLQKNFEASNKEEPKKTYRIIQEATEKKEQPDAGYQLVPPSRSSISRGNDTPQVQNSIDAVADAIVSAADEVVEGLGDLITPSAQGNDYAEAAWQHKLRNQANRKKKRGRGL